MNEEHDINDTIAKIDKPVSDLFDYSRRSRHLIWFLAVILILVLIGGLGLWKVHDDQRASDRRQTYNSCLGGNDFRTADKQRWQEVIDLFPAPQNEAGREQLAKINAINAKADKLRVCIR